MVDIRIVLLGILTLCVSTMAMATTPIEPSERPSKAFPEVCWYVIDTAKDNVIEKKCKDMNPFLPLSQKTLDEELNFKIITYTVNNDELSDADLLRPSKDNCIYEVITCG